MDLEPVHRGTTIRNGHLYDVWSDGRVLPRLSGAAEGDPPDPDPGGGGEDPPDPKGQKTFSQDDVKRIAVKEKREGREAAERALAEKLGVPIDDAIRLLKEAKEQEERNKTEAQKGLEKEQKRATEAEAKAAEAEARAFTSDVKLALVLEGVNQQRLEHAIKLVDVAPGASEDDLKAAIGKLKEDLPEMFGPAQPQDQRPKPKGSDPGPSPRTPAPAKMDEKVRSRLESRHGATLARTKSS